MSTRINTDNIYPIGSFIYAKENPTQQLLINDYYQRIYYCSKAGFPELREKVYFERELVPPGTDLFKKQY